MKYKIKKKIIFALKNVKYNESSYKLFHTYSNDITILLNATTRDKWKFWTNVWTGKKMEVLDKCMDRKENMRM